MVHPKISIVIPARDEERDLPACLHAVSEATHEAKTSIETIVVLNRCTDATETIARAHGCIIGYCELKNLSKIRNAGAALAKGEILITIDADSRMARNFINVI